MNPLTLGADSQQYIKNFNGYQVRKAKQQREEDERVHVFRPKSTQEVIEALAQTKEQNRRPLFISSLE